MVTSPGARSPRESGLLRESLGDAARTTNQRRRRAAGEAELTQKLQDNLLFLMILNIFLKTLS